MISPTVTAIVDTAREWPRQRVDALQRIYEQYWDFGQERAGHRVVQALERAGVYADTGPGTVADQVDSLCGIVGGASDVAIALLARDLDLIDPADFERLTHWWVVAGEPLPARQAR